MKDGMTDGSSSVSHVQQSSHQGINEYSYDVLDEYPDTADTLDSWGEFLRARIRNRESLYLNADTSAQELIRKEIQRIRYFRKHFKDYRVHASDQLPLVALLDESRKKWRDVAVKRAEADLIQIKAAERDGVGRSRIRDKKVLGMVKNWQSEKYERWQRQMTPDEYIPGLDAAPSADEKGFIEDDPTKEDYGYNGWLIEWNEDHGWVNSDNPLVHGEFPHQKISIQQFLYNKEGTPLKRCHKKDRFRYFHLPANNMKWVEEAIMRYYGEEGVEFDHKRVLGLKSNSQRLLRNELWRGQQRGGASLPAHARQIATRCSTVPSAPMTRADHRRPSELSRGKDVVFYMPFLHWEVEKRLRRMRQFVQVAKGRKDTQDRLRRATTNRWRRGGGLADVARGAQDQAQRGEFDLKRPMTGFEGERKEKGRIAWRPQTPLAKYFWHVAKLYQIIDEAADGRLIEDHLYSDPPLHARRTLEQFYYWTAGDTARRDKDQVVCRGTRNPNIDLDPEATSRIVMVDQLWLWILDDNTVISAFPRRWGRNKPDPSAVHRSIRDRFNSMPPEEIGSVHDIALVVIDECSKVFFDDSKPADERPDVVNLFSSAISNIAENKTIAYEGFGRDISRLSIETLENAERLLRKSLNINFEWSILEEALQVVDELGIMQDIFGQQLKAMDGFSKFLQEKYGVAGTAAMGSGSGSGSFGTLGTFGHNSMTFDDLEPCRQKTLEMMAGTMGNIEQRKEELASMKELQTETRKQVRELLDMKQQQANIIEAKAAIRRADESVTQGRSIVVFTVVTIFFLPLSFFTSIFGMNVVEFSSDGVLALNDTLKYMFAISAAVIVVSLALAFSEWVRTVISVGFGLVYVRIEDLLGWRHKKAAYNSVAIRNIRRQKMEQLENRDRFRRHTESDSRRETMNSNRPDLKHRSTWDVRKLTDGGASFFGRFRKREKSLREAGEPV